MRRSHGQTRPTLGLALAFVAVGASSAALGAGRWFALHLVLAGGVVLAISAVSLMLTVTWAAAPAPPDRYVVVQRVAVAAGAAGIAIGRRTELPSVVVAASGLLYVAGLVVLAVLLVVTVRRGVERRFDAAVVAYVVALVFGVVAAAFGVAMATDAAGVGVRSAHVTFNLLGLVGVVVVGTLPFFAATVGRARMAPQATPRRLVVVVGWQTLALSVAGTGLMVGVGVVAAAGLFAYGAGVAAVLALLPRPTRRQLRWAGPRLPALWVGASWWALAVVVTALDAVTSPDAVWTGRWLLVLVVAGYGQIVWGSLAYLVPMLRGGGHERLSSGFATTRSWLGFVAVNVAGIALVCSWATAAALAIGVWLLDTGGRLLHVVVAPALADRGMSHADSGGDGTLQ